jgi:hypothetical protein
MIKMINETENDLCNKYLDEFKEDTSKQVNELKENLNK